jgi:uracil phosphoribosyltransferase
VFKKTIAGISLLPRRLLRDKRTTPYQFRQLVSELCALVGYEATVDLGLKPKDVTTPLVATSGFETSDIVGLVPVLRAGIGMVEPFLSMLPNAQVCPVLRAAAHAKSA